MMECGRELRIYSVVAFSAIGGLLFGYQTGVISGVLIMTDFQKMTNISDTEENATNILSTKVGLIVGILLFGCVLGSLIGGQTSDRFSRKYSISFFAFIFTISSGLQILRAGLVPFLAARFFAGIAVGALSMIVPVYQSEIAATKIRGRLTTLQQLAITIGIAISFWVNYSTSTSKKLNDDPWQWRIPLGIQVIPSSILAVGILFCPFSPRWLISQDREDEARVVLMNIRSTSHDEIEEEMNRIKNEVAYLRENEVDSYRQLFRPPLRYPLLLGIGIQILQQLTGINPINYYAPKFFAIILQNQTDLFGDANDHSFSSALLTTGYYGCIKVIFTIPAIIFVDKIGRRILLIIGGIIMFTSMSVTTCLIADYIPRHCNVTSHYCAYDPPPEIIANTIVGSIYVFVAGYSFSWAPIPWIYCTEIFPLTMRAKATSLTTAANWAANFVISFLIPLLFIHIYYGIFIIFFVFCALMTGIIYFLYPETKNQHLEWSDLVDDQRTLVPQWLQNRRNYNTFPSQTTVSQLHTPVLNEQNSICDSTGINNEEPPSVRTPLSSEQ